MRDVNLGNFTRAETDLAIKRLFDTLGGFGTWFHDRPHEPVLHRALHGLPGVRVPART